MNKSSDNKVIHNTLMLYIRMAFVILVGLYTSRVILNVLGVNDFGIYNVVCGIVLIFQSISGSLSLVTSRFLSLELSKNDFEQLKKVFSVSVVLHWIIALTVLIICETVGMWFLENKLVISPDRLDAAKIVLHLSTLTFMFSLLQLPYYSCIISHEEMDAVAYISIAESVLKLIMTYLLQNFGNDKLVLYAFLMLFISIMVTLLYYVYSRKKYDETKFMLIKEKALYKPVLKFFGWNFFESLSMLTHQNGINFLQNMFFGVEINAAMGIAIQVRNNVRTFQGNFLVALQPHIFKQYASNSIENKENVEKTIISAMKISYLLMAIFVVPMCFEMDYILKLWLKNPPPHSSEFTIYFLVYSLAYAVITPLVVAVQATGNNKTLSLYGGICYVSAVPIAYIMLLNGGTYNTAVIVSTLIGFIYNLLSFVFLKKEIPEVSIFKITLKSILPMIIVSIIAITLIYAIHTNISSTMLRFLSTLIGGFAIITITSYCILLNRDEKHTIISIIKEKLKIK